MTTKQAAGDIGAAPEDHDSVCQSAQPTPTLTKQRMTKTELDAISKLKSDIPGMSAIQLKRFESSLISHLKAIEELKTNDPEMFVARNFFSQIQPSEELAKAALETIKSPRNA